MTTKEITQALKDSKIMRWYDLPNMTSFKDYTPQELDNLTHIYINTDDQSWQPGYDDIIPQNAQNYYTGELEISNHKIPVYVY